MINKISIIILIDYRELDTILTSNCRINFLKEAKRICDMEITQCLRGGVIW